MKRVLVTGGSRGLGLEICRSLARSGWNVTTVSRGTSPELSRAIQEFPGLITSHRADLSKTDEIERISADLRVKEGYSGFIANAAIGTEGLLTLTSAAKIEECIRLNLTGVILLTREVLKGMLGRGGSIVFVSSISAKRGYAGLSVYAATKGGLLSFSRTLAREYGARGIRSNCVIPGFLDTEMTRTLSPEDKEQIRRRTPLKRLGATADIVSTVEFLLSESSAFVTGGEFTVDGGFSV